MNVPRKLALLFLTILSANIVIFGLYRVVFLWHFAPWASAEEVLHVLSAGLRLDAAWLGLECSLFALILLLSRKLRWRPVVLCLWCVAMVHVWICVANFFCFAERNQNSGELILPYITSPYQVYLAVMPFCQAHWGLMLGGIVIAICGLALGWGLSRRFAPEPLSLWQNRATVLTLVALIIAPLLMTLTVISRKKVKWLIGYRGWSIKVVESKYFTHHRDHCLNEALLNPLYELIRVQIPAQLQTHSDYHLTETEAANIWQGLRDGAPLDARYPLLTEIRGTENSTIKNVIIVQVEGLSQSILDQRRKDRPVVPFLRELAAQGYYFSNTVQNANYTSGGVFSTLTGVPKATYDQVSHRFTSFEMNARYGSLAHILGDSNYTHYFYEAFRQSWNDFMSFTSRQGYEARGYEDFKDMLEAKDELGEADSSLGIFDTYFFQECAQLLLDCPTHFTAHLMTCTTHSPWIVPESFTPLFAEEELNAFAYFDASLEEFCLQLQRKPSLWEETLIVVIGDHTSVTFGNDPMERLRIPLIFFSPKLPQQFIQGNALASQVDVVPTVLGLLPGKHWYAGMGRNLLDGTAPKTGVIGGTTEMGYYLKDGHMLEYRPAEEDFRIVALTNGKPSRAEKSELEQEKMNSLRREYLAQVELAKRMAIENRIFPPSSDGRAKASDAPAAH